jgi:uncharacterized membrane protein YkoI
MRWRHLVAATALTAVGIAALPSAAAMTADQIKKQVESVSGGKVLKIEPREVGTLKGYAVTIMNPGGNTNSAFQVYTVIVDAENGTIVPEHRLDRHY